MNKKCFVLRSSKDHNDFSYEDILNPVFEV
jgi:hypothetical protein